LATFGPPRFEDGFLTIDRVFFQLAFFHARPDFCFIARVLPVHQLEDF